MALGSVVGNQSWNLTGSSVVKKFRSFENLDLKYYFQYLYREFIKVFYESSLPASNDRGIVLGRPYQPNGELGSINE